MLNLCEAFTICKTFVSDHASNEYINVLIYMLSMLIRCMHF